MEVGVVGAVVGGGVGGRRWEGAKGFRLVENGDSFMFGGVFVVNDSIATSVIS